MLGLRVDEDELIGYERDDLHREVARHQGNRLLQTQQWDPAGRLKEQLLGRSDDQSILIKRNYHYDAAYAIHKPRLPNSRLTVYRGISGEQFHGSSAS